MKIRYDFVTNSSSTSFVIISDGEFNLKDFIAAVGIENNSPFLDIYEGLFEAFKSDMITIREYYADNKADRFETFEKFITEGLYIKGESPLKKILDAEKEGKAVYMGRLRSDNDDTECFFCTDSFIIETDKLYVDARESGW